MRARVRTARALAGLFDSKNSNKNSKKISKTIWTRSDPSGGGGFNRFAHSAGQSCSVDRRSLQDGPKALKSSPQDSLKAAEKFSENLRCIVCTFCVFRFHRFLFALPFLDELGTTKNTETENNSWQLPIRFESSNRINESNQRIESTNRIKKSRR